MQRGSTVNGLGGLSQKTINLRYCTCAVRAYIRNQYCTVSFSPWCDYRRNQEPAGSTSLAAKLLHSILYVNGCTYRNEPNEGLTHKPPDHTDKM
jgi:hypothetical protein